MKHDVYPGDRAPTHLRLAQVAPQKVDVAVHTREIGFAPRAEIVHHSNLVSKRDQPLGQMGACKAGAAARVPSPPSHKTRASNDIRVAAAGTGTAPRDTVWRGCYSTPRSAVGPTPVARSWSNGCCAHATAARSHLLPTLPAEWDRRAEPWHHLCADEAAQCDHHKTRQFSRAGGDERDRGKPDSSHAGNGGARRGHRGFLPTSVESARDRRVVRIDPAAGRGRQRGRAG